MRSRVGLIILLALARTAAAGCARGGAGGPSAPGTSPAGEHQAMDHSMNMPAVTAATASPQQLRAEFEQLLGQHTLIAVRAMRSVVSKAPDLQQAVAESLRQNTDELSRLVATAYGAAEGDRFRQLWQGHITGLMSYANGVANHDAAATQKARDALLAYCDAHGAWFAGATKGRVRAGDAAALVRMHVEDLMMQLDAYAAGDYQRAYAIERAAFEHMFTAGAPMAKASLTPEQAVGFDAPPNKLRSAFAMLLGEHMELIIDAQRATFADAPQFKGAAAQVNSNTTALTQAMGTLVGARKAAEFQAAWADHVDGLIAYAAATAARDQAGKTAADKRLNSFAVTLAAYFSGVVRDQRMLVPLTGAITAHDRHLMNHVNAYAAKDYARAQQMERDGYQQMLEVANTLVNAIQRTVGPGLPVGGPNTGGGGTARRPG